MSIVVFEDPLPVPSQTTEGADAALLLSLVCTSPSPASPSTTCSPPSSSESSKENYVNGTPSSSTTTPRSSSSTVHKNSARTGQKRIQLVNAATGTRIHPTSPSHSAALELALQKARSSSSSLQQQARSALRGSHAHLTPTFVLNKKSSPSRRIKPIHISTASSDAISVHSAPAKQQSSSSSSAVLFPDTVSLAESSTSTIPPVSHTALKPQQHAVVDAPSIEQEVAKISTPRTLSLSLSQTSVGSHSALPPPSPLTPSALSSPSLNPRLLTEYKQQLIRAKSIPKDANRATARSLSAASTSALASSFDPTAAAATTTHGESAVSSSTAASTTSSSTSISHTVLSSSPSGRLTTRTLSSPSGFSQLRSNSGSYQCASSRIKVCIKPIDQIVVRAHSLLDDARLNGRKSLRTYHFP